MHKMEGEGQVGTFGLTDQSESSIPQSSLIKPICLFSSSWASTERRVLRFLLTAPTKGLAAPCRWVHLNTWLMTQTRWVRYLTTSAASCRIREGEWSCMKTMPSIITCCCSWGATLTWNNRYVQYATAEASSDKKGVTASSTTFTLLLSFLVIAGYKAPPLKSPSEIWKEL